MATDAVVETPMNFIWMLIILVFGLILVMSIFAPDSSFLLSKILNPFRM